MHRVQSRARSIRLAAVAASLALSTTVFPALAAVAPVAVAVAPYPNNAAGTLPAFVTNGELVGFDVTIGNGNSTTTGVTFTGAVSESPSVAADATYIGTFVMGGSAAGQVSCTQSGSFSCNVGNLSGGASLALRVVYRAPTLTSTEVGTRLTFTITGQGNGSTPNDKGNNSQGDTFTASASVDVVQLFANDAARRGVAALITDTSAFTRTTDPSGFGPSNPTLTEVRIPAFASQSEIPFGTSLWFTEFTAPGSECPAASCFGQTVDLHYFDGQPAPRPFRVTLTQDNVKSVVATPSKWTIYHVLDDGVTVEKPFDVTCSFVNGLPTNAPCGEKRDKTKADKNDYYAIFWLTENGRIWGG